MIKQYLVGSTKCRWWWQKSEMPNIRWLFNVVNARARTRVRWLLATFDICEMFETIFKPMDQFNSHICDDQMTWNGEIRDERNKHTAHTTIIIHHLWMPIFSIRFDGKWLPFEMHWTTADVELKVQFPIYRFLFSLSASRSWDDSILNFAVGHKNTKIAPHNNKFPFSFESHIKYI